MLLDLILTLGLRKAAFVLWPAYTVLPMSGLVRSVAFSPTRGVIWHAQCSKIQKTVSAVAQDYQDYFLMGLAITAGGMTFQALFRQCRERFLVANEIALRSHLSEFKDHRLLQARWGCWPTALAQTARMQWDVETIEKFDVEWAIEGGC